MSLLMDLIVVAFFLAVVIHCYQKGLLRSVIELLGYVASLVVAGFLSAPIGNWINEHILQSLINNRINGYLSSAQEGGNADISKLTQGLASIWNGQFPNYSVNAGAIQKASGSSDASAVSSLIKQYIVAPVAESIGRVIAFVIIFFLCLIIIRIIANISDIIFKIPVIGQINKVGGAAIGMIKALIVLWLISVVLAILIPIFSLQKNPPVTNTTINNTLVYKYLYYSNPIRDILLKN